MICYATIFNTFGEAVTQAVTCTKLWSNSQSIFIYN